VLRYGGAAALAVAVVVGATGIASAVTSSGSTTVPPNPFRADRTAPAAFGTVQSVGANTFTLSTFNGSRLTVDVTGSTTYRDGVKSTASFADVVVGQHVAVMGSRAGSTLTATKVFIGVSGTGSFGAAPAAFGTVRSVGHDTFTLTTLAGSTITVDVTSSTTYADPKVTTPSFADVTVGQHVAAVGSRNGTTLHATKVLIGGHRRFGLHQGFGGMPAAFGTVRSVGNGAFTVTSFGGATLTVDVNGATTYVDPSAASPSFGDVTVGAHVVVAGSRSGSTVTATRILISGPGAFGRPSFGGEGGPSFSG